MSELNQNNLVALMNKMRSMVPADQAPPECSEIDWSIPHHHGEDELEILNTFTNKLAAYIQGTLQRFCDDNFEAKVKKTSEHFACFLVNEVNQNESKSYFLPITVADTGHVGFIELSFESSTKLIAQMLCDPEAEIGAEGEISSLEESILQDIIFALVDSIIQGFSEYNVASLQKTDQLICGEWPVRFRGLEDMTKVSFEAKCPTVEIEISLYLLDQVVAPLVGGKTSDTSPELLKKMPERIVGCMQEAPMEVSAQLSSAMITLNDVMTIQQGDVIVLDRKVNDPVDVLVNGQTCFQAWPAQHAGRSAIVVADSNKDG
jgi:flagellar motor switch protein FliM